MFLKLCLPLEEHISFFYSFFPYYASHSPPGIVEDVVFIYIYIRIVTQLNKNSGFRARQPIIGI
jgi:hypothetical protein